MIEIVPYNPLWPAEFEQIAAQVRGVLGEQALRVDHIGSTSVPGLAAKDIIDMQVAVNNFDERLAPALVSLGYVARPDITSDHQPPLSNLPDSQWEKRYFKSPDGARRVNLHVRILGNANQRYALLFRDYLRAHPAAASGYSALKQVLAKYHPDDLEAYTVIKDPVCDLIMGAAEEWALATNWKAPGPE
jgi:GrpB-like predicted nucleotidyltransferase (UPF0157 family)